MLTGLIHTPNKGSEKHRNGFSPLPQRERTCTQENISPVGLYAYGLLEIKLIQLLSYSTIDRIVLSQLIAKLSNMLRHSKSQSSQLTENLKTLPQERPAPTNWLNTPAS
jgi:hypothetical protein